MMQEWGVEGGVGMGWDGKGAVVMGTALIVYCVLRSDMSRAGYIVST
jgi:hypothetical protein